MKRIIFLVTVSAFCSRGLQAQTFNNVGTSYAGTPSALNGTPSQLQTAQDNQILLQGNNVFGSDAARNDIRLGIGVFSSPINGIADRLHLNDITANGVFTRFTNSNTGQTVTDGFAGGIDASGNVLMQQFENLPMMFHTNATERLRIFANGNLGINNTTGNNRLEITSGTGNPYFASGASSGLRFTNLTKSSTVNDTSSRVLAVDNNGDVVLVKPITAGSITGLAASQNGLNSSTSPYVELGGNLIKATTVDLNSYVLVFNNTGRFGIGGSITVSNISTPLSGFGTNNAKIVFDNDNYEETQRIYANAASGFSPSYLHGLVIEAQNSLATTNTTGAKGIKATVSSDGTNNCFEGYVSSSSSNVTGINTCYYGTAINGLEAFGGYLHAYQGNQTSPYSAYGLYTQTNYGYLNHGVHGSADNGIKNYGGYFDAQQYNTPDPGYVENTGVFGGGTNGPAYNTGVDGRGSGGLWGGSALSAIGVYGHAETGVDVIGVKGECPVNGGETAGSNKNLAGYFIGDVEITGDASILGVSMLAAFPAVFSDQTLKTNIKPIENGMNIINKLSPKTYTLKNDNCKQLDFSKSKTQYGLIAQEVESVIPDIVYTTNIPADRDSKGNIINEKKELKAVSYEQLISVLIKGMQEQQKQISDLTEQVNTLSRKIDDVSSQTVNRPGNSASTPGQSQVTLSDNNVVILEQNIPNPFFESTVVNYILPTGYSTAKIVFTTTNGNLVKEVDLSQVSGNALTVYASNLSNGVYNYSLVVDGKIIDTKKMVKD